MQITVLTILGVFTLLTAAYQITYFKRGLNFINKYHTLPNYSFFAPKPLIHDYRLIYQLGDENSSWAEIPILEKFRFRRIIWNPQKYYNKAFIDTCHQLFEEHRLVEDPSYIQLSANYIKILSITSEYLTKWNGANTPMRFAVLSSEGNQGKEVLRIAFISNNHLIKF